MEDIVLDDHHTHQNLQSANYKEWPFIEAKRILKATEKEQKTRVVFETGYGPSGLPHIGTFGEVARTTYVRTALAELAPDLPTKLIAFSDDMDGLRSLPENVPNHDLISEHLGKPLNAVPDPYGEFDSFSSHMNNRLKEFLDSFNFEYEFRSSTDMYRGGFFNEALSLIMKNHKKITEIFTATISEEKGANWSPFFPICERCGKIYTTRVTGYHTDTNEVSYECVQSPNALILPCHFKGRISIFDGHVKVGWKIDWALRWHSLGIDYEMYGKDLMESFVISEKVIRLMGRRPPLGYKYELFLDEEGRKISKKIGNGVSLEEWLRYAPKDILLYFMYSKPSQAKRMGLSLIPRFIDEYKQRLSSYKGEVDSPITIMKYKQIKDGSLEIPVSKMEYALILNLVRALNVSDPQIVMDYLLRYDPTVAHNKQYFEELVNFPIAYNEEFMKHRKMELHIDRDLDGYLKTFKSGLIELQEHKTASPETVQTLAFDIAKDNNLPVKEWFKYLYQVLLSQESGPKIGSFVCLYGLGATLLRIDEYLASLE